MGLTITSTGAGAVDAPLLIRREKAGDRIIALAGNPNVGKSTVFNAITHMHQHTGNWPGKTVSIAQGRCAIRGRDYIFVDLPGTYSLLTRSAEEEAAGDFLLHGGADAVVVVCDASCLERNLNLVFQILEITSRVVVCVNLMDEAEKKQISVDISALSDRLGVPVVGASARSGKGIDELLRCLDRLCSEPPVSSPPPICYPPAVEKAVSLLTLSSSGSEPSVRGGTRWQALRLLGGAFSDQAVLPWTPEEAGKALSEAGLSEDTFHDAVVSRIMEEAESVAGAAVFCANNDCHRRDRLLDRIFISRSAGIPVMLLLLAGILWLTISGANFLSEALSGLLFGWQDRLSLLISRLSPPFWLHDLLINGVYRVLAWIVSVMLPPMAIFFPLFTLLEDFGYLPRVAFNLDHCFKKVHACGKQSLCMCMGLGCNAAGVVGCRIIDSPRERLVAILTNSFMPCNGRFPMLISLISLFLVRISDGFPASLLSALILTGVILLGIALTFLSSRLLSATCLRGIPSSFTLELPPYRRPQIGRVIIRSVFDRTLFVLARAAVVAAPAGAIIWIMANFTIGGSSLLVCCTRYLDPFARLLGMDGVILLAFILGFPANEIVLPLIVTAYTSSGMLVGASCPETLRSLLLANGWTAATAVSVILFSLSHWPCSTTCLTILKETGSKKWTAAAIALPTLCGMTLCFLFTAFVRLLGGI